MPYSQQGAVVLVKGILILTVSGAIGIRASIGKDKSLSRRDFGW